MTVLLSLAIGFMLGLIALIFAFQNNDIVSLTFMNWNFESSLAIVVILSLLAGVLISTLLTIPGAIARSISMHSLKKENRSLKDMMLEKQDTVVVETVEKHFSSN